MEAFDFYFKYAITVDNVIFGFDEGELKVLLIKRGEEPYDGMWALPGYFVKPAENLDDAAMRILTELTGVSNVYLEQVASYGAVDRHPFGRVITVAYYSLVKIEDYHLKADSIATLTTWKEISQIGSLAFDHNEIFRDCLERLRQHLRARPIGFELLPMKFTLTELQHLYEAILELSLDKRNFRKKILSTDMLIDLKEVQEGVAHRPAKLYKFDKEKYANFAAKGFSFEV